MKKIINLLAALFVTMSGFAQVLPGTLDVTGMPNLTQTLADVTTEAGQDDKEIGFESEFDATIISFILDPTSSPITGITSSEENCSVNVFRYKVFVHRSYSFEFEKTIIEAKTFANSGQRFPEVSPYDNLLIQPLGPRDLYPANGGAYIEIPDDPSRAVKIMEFIGCRTNIPIQFRIQPSTLSPAGISNIEIYYTIVGSLL
jgi:hypothetical protein